MMALVAAVKMQKETFHEVCIVLCVSKVYVCKFVWVTLMGLAGVLLGYRLNLRFYDY